MSSSSLTRREWLSILLGAPLAEVACRRQPPRAVDGRVVGGRMLLGHRVQNLGDLPVAPRVREVPIVIVGAGIAGLSAAWRLERSGESRYVVVELESRAGGTATYGTDGVVPYPWAAHYLPLPSSEHESLCSLLLEMGVVERDRDGSLVPHEEHLVRAPEERIFQGGRWHEGVIPVDSLDASERGEFAMFQQLVNHWAAYRDGDGRRAFTIPLAHCSMDSHVTSLDRVSAADWFNNQGFQSKALRWFLEYGCRDDYGTTLENTSAWALLFYHCSRAQSGGKSAPFLTWPEGNGRIVRHLEQVVGARLHRDRLVVDILPEQDGARISVLDSRTNEFELLIAKQVIVAVPTFVAKHIVRPFRDAQPSYYSEFSYSPWLVANLHLKKRPKAYGAPLAWDNVIYQGASLGYVVATHQTLEDDGKTILTYYQPFVDSDPVLARRRLAIAEHARTWDAVVAELGAAHPDFESCVTRMDVWHWGHAMVRPTPGFLFGGARRKAAEPYGVLHFAGTDLSGMALLDEAHFHGVRTADAALARLRVG